MLLFLGGAHRMGSTWQAWIVREGLKLAGRESRRVEAPRTVAAWYDQEGIERIVARCDADPATCWRFKAHLAFAEQIACVVGARDAVFFQIWRDWRETLVSDFHFALNISGRRHPDLDTYYRRRGRLMLLRSRIQHLNWHALGDPRVVHARYEDLRRDFAPAAGAMLAPLGLGAVDMAELAHRTSMATMRAKLATRGRESFVRAGSLDSHRTGGFGAEVERDIDAILAERDAGALVREWDRATRLKSLIVGREYARRDPRRKARLFLEHAGVLPRLRRLFSPSP